MEGSRNEKIVIVLSAYVIGFTTAFIAFGINNSYTPSVPEEDFSRSYVQPLSVKVAPQVISSIEENDEGFFAVIGGYKRMLSAKRSTLGANVIASNATSGFYTAIIANTLSKDAQFVYFCEQQKTDAKDCAAYVYSLADDSLHRVKVNGKSYDPIIEGHTALWNDDTTLVLNGITSTEAIKPWNFTMEVVKEAESAAPVVTAPATPSDSSEVTVESKPEIINVVDEKPILQ